MLHACSGMKTLGEPDDEETASDWVQKLRVLQEEKEKADKRVIRVYTWVLVYTSFFYCLCIIQAQMLAEMDEEFGVGELIQGTLQQQKQQVVIGSMHVICTCI